MLGRITAVGDDKQSVYVEFDSKVSFNMGQEVTVNNPRKLRTQKQNSLYWVFLEWVINPFGGDLQSQGHFHPDALHDNVKAWVEVTHPHKFKIDKRFTTTELTRKEFGEFFDLVKQELFVEILSVDISGFEKDYERFGTWQETNPGGMNEYLKERLPF
jgi:hypothetical protein